MAARLIICSKSPWEPSIRREHALARLAAANGHEVVFLERAADVRSVRADRRWAAGLVGRRKPFSAAPGIEVRRRSTIVPGHRGQAGVRLETVLLRRELARLGASDSTVVATVPWQWPAVAATRAARRVFDCADNWAERIPQRRALFLGLHDRIARQADAVVAVSEAIAELFTSGSPRIIPNGTTEELLAAPPSKPPAQPSLVFVGTLSERFDAPLVSRALDLLPRWRLELYGQCQYAGAGDRPGPELTALLESFPDRASWHGVVGRSGLPHVLDAGRVLLVPYRRFEHPASSMKLFDYAARGRPIVSTRWAGDLERNGPPHLYLADTPEETALAVEAAAEEPRGRAAARRAWAEAERYESRWPEWSRALFGS